MPEDYYAQRLSVVPCPDIAARLPRLKTRSELRDRDLRPPPTDEKSAVCSKALVVDPPTPGAEFSPNFRQSGADQANFEQLNVAQLPKLPIVHARHWSSASSHKHTQGGIHAKSRTFATEQNRLGGALGSAAIQLMATALVLLASITVDVVMRRRGETAH